MIEPSLIAEKTDQARPLPLVAGQADTLDLLARVGQDITASLAFSDIFAAIERYVGQLLDTATLYIGLLDETGEWLDVPLFVDGGARAASRRMRVDDPARPAARCVRERCEILRHKTLEEALETDIPGTQPTLTALFGPLLVRDRIIGVISVQSARSQAYGDRERLIFRLLSSYAAVALANAESYRRLAQAESDKVASLGQLVAGIAHEVNTPVGTALTISTGLERLADEFAAILDSGALRRSDLAAFAERTGIAARQLTANLTRASDLVGRFKQVVAESSQTDRRIFSLSELVGALMTSLPHELTGPPNRIEIDVPLSIMLDTSPGAVGHILSNLLTNAVEHGCMPGRPGTVGIVAEMPATDLVVIRVSDDGPGIAPSDLPFVFDPFFTTRRNRGGAGLGLYIARNLAVTTLAGRLSCTSRPAAGTTFRLEIPSSLPE